ncbi:MAG: hypothetical protein WA978_09785 [Sphingopyxis granuli]|uniref:hypothetical protein n=1 Tax=Sphingopyxis granuli TaxID=267128 RepID=UPI003C7697C3
MAVEYGSFSATLVVSAVTSAVVSIATFIIGVRMAKDQGDRAVARDIYQRLFSHFEDLKRSIDDGAPKSWEAFPLVDNKFMPVFRKMQRTGECHLLPPKILADCEAIETALLAAGLSYRKWIVATYGPALSRLATDLTGGRTESIFGRPSVDLSAGRLALLEARDQDAIVARLQERDQGIQLAIPTEQPLHQRSSVYPEHLEFQSLALFLKRATELRSADPEGSKLVAEIRMLDVRLISLLARLRRRIRDPHPLHESIIHAMADLRPG